MQIEDYISPEELITYKLHSHWKSNVKKTTLIVMLINFILYYYFYYFVIVFSFSFFFSFTELVMEQ